MSDAELARAGIHLSMISSMFDALVRVLERVHVAAGAALVYEAWPEIKGDVEELIKDVAALIDKIGALA